MASRHEEALIDKLQVHEWKSETNGYESAGLLRLAQEGRWELLVETATTMTGIPLFRRSSNSNICRLMRLSVSFLPQLLPGLTSIIAGRSQELASSPENGIHMSSLESLILSGGGGEGSLPSWCQTSSNIRLYLSAAQWLLIMYLPSNLLPDGKASSEAVAQAVEVIKRDKLLHEGLFFRIEFWDSLMEFNDWRGTSVTTNFTFSKVMRHLIHWCLDHTKVPSRSRASSIEEHAFAKASIGACFISLQKRVARLYNLVVAEASSYTQCQRIMETMNGHLLVDGEASELFRYAILRLSASWRDYSETESSEQAIADHYHEFQCGLSLALTVTTFFGVRAQVLNDLCVDYCVVSLDPRVPSDHEVLSKVREFCLRSGDSEEHERLSNCLLLSQQYEQTEDFDGGLANQHQSASIVRVRFIDLLCALPFDIVVRRTWRLFVLRGKEKVDEHVRARSILVILPCVQPFVAMWIRRFWMPVALGLGGDTMVTSEIRNRQLRGSFWLYSPQPSSCDSFASLRLLSTSSKRMSDFMKTYIQAFNPSLNMGMTDFRREVCTRTISPDKLSDLLAFMTLSGCENETEESVTSLLESFLNVSRQRIAEVYARNNPEELERQRKLLTFATSQTSSIAREECDRLHAVFRRQTEAYQTVTGVTMDELLTGPSVETDDGKERLLATCVFRQNGERIDGDGDATCIYDSRSWSQDGPSIQVYVTSVPVTLRHHASLWSIARKDSELIAALLHPSSVASQYFDCYPEDYSLALQERWSPLHEELAAEMVTIPLPKQLAQSLRQRGLAACFGSNVSSASNSVDKLRHCFHLLQHSPNPSSSVSPRGRSRTSSSETSSATSSPAPHAASNALSSSTSSSSSCVSSVTTSTSISTVSSSPTSNSSSTVSTASTASSSSTASSIVSTTSSAQTLTNKRSIRTAPTNAPVASKRTKISSVKATRNRGIEEFFGKMN